MPIPCGVAQAKDILSAYNLAYATDPTSAFGGIIPLTANWMPKRRQKSSNASLLKSSLRPPSAPPHKPCWQKNKTLRALECGAWHSANEAALDFNALPAASWFKTKTSAKSARPTQGRQQTRTHCTGIGRSTVRLERSPNLLIQRHRLLQKRPDHRCGRRQMSRVYSARIAASKPPTKLGGSRFRHGFGCLFPVPGRHRFRRSSCITAVNSAGGSIA